MKLKQIAIEAVLVMIMMIPVLVCVLVEMRAQEKPVASAAPSEVPQFSDAITATLAKATAPLQAQLGDIATQEALLTQAFTLQEQNKARLNAEIQNAINAALKAAGLDPAKYTVDSKSLLVQEKPQQPTPAAVPHAPPPAEKK